VAEFTIRVAEFTIFSGNYKTFIFRRLPFCEIEGLSLILSHKTMWRVHLFGANNRGGATADYTRGKVVVGDYRIQLTQANNDLP
jgi:hypothetical protein